jgi:hypothetical protein
MKNKYQASYIIYEDESGVVGTTGYFLVGLLFVPRETRKNLYCEINNLRKKYNFYSQMHFKDLLKKSLFRAKLFSEVIETVFKENLQFRSYYIDNTELDLAYFGQTKYKAYNYFTKELLKNNYQYIGNIKNAVLYLERRSRVKGDNITDYIRREINLSSGTEYQIIKKIEFLKPNKDDLLQVTDLILGTIHNKLTGNPLPTKVMVRKIAEKHYGTKIRFWKWNFPK